MIRRLELDRSKFTHEVINILESSQFETAHTVMKSLLSIGGRMSPEEGDQFITENSNLLEYKHIASKVYESYIFNLELLDANRLLNAEKSGLSFINSVSDFGKTAHDRVRDMFEHIDFDICKCFVLVGCGSLPVTMFNVYNRTEVPKIVGLDTRSSAIELTQRAFDKYGLERMTSVMCVGQEYDFSGANVIYVANMISPKKKVIDRIVETALPGSQIILRDPYSIGRLWAEAGVDDLNEKCKIVGYGAFGPAYYSRDVYLKLS